MQLSHKCSDICEHTERDSNVVKMKAKKYKNIYILSLVVNK